MRNAERDAETNRLLTDAGWTVVRVCGHGCGHILRVEEIKNRRCLLGFYPKERAFRVHSVWFESGVKRLLDFLGVIDAACELDHEGHWYARRIELENPREPRGNPGQFPGERLVVIVGFVVILSKRQSER